MNYDLSRIDYTLCGITFPDTLKILPPAGPKIHQKFAVGDKNGVLQCISIKDEEPVIQFKTLPGKPITSVQLAFTTGTQSDKVFAASGNEVKGYTRKGKVFLTLETSLSETITSMCVLGGDLLLGSGRMVTHYRDLHELHAYTCEDRVLDIAAFAAPNSTRLRLLALVANKGVVILEAGEISARAAVASGPSRLTSPPWLHNSEVCVYFGAVDGSIGIITFDGNTLTVKSLVDGKSLGAVMSLGWFYSNGGAHLLVGRHDGSIQLYLVDMENIVEVPRLKYTYFCGEPIISVDGGCVGTEEPEILAATYSGRVFALRPRHLLSEAAAMANIPQDAIAARRSKLESEIIRLEKQVANEREKYQKSTRSLHAGLSTPPLLDVQCELSGATREGWQEMRVTSAVPLDMLFLYCDRKLELQTDSAAVLSVCPSQGNLGDLLATVRCQAGTRRLWVRVRSGRNSSHPVSTKLLVYTLPAGAPRVARLIVLQLPALPYYSQHEDSVITEDIERAWCSLRVSGSFSVAEMTSWLSQALPGDLPRPSTVVDFSRSHTLLETVLVCRYQRSVATFKCDNISTIIILRDILLNCSVEKSIHVDIKTDISDGYCVKAFKKIENIFKEEFQKHKDIILMKAISVLDLDSNMINAEDTVLCDEYLRIWRISSEETEVLTNFEDLVETVENWFTDWFKLSMKTGDVYKQKMDLTEALKECQLAKIHRIF